MSKKSTKGWIVTAAGTGINLALGVLYAWSVFKKDLVKAGWTNTEASLPYTVAIAVFALMMVPAGRLQDKIGPKYVAGAGGALTGLGLILASFFSDSVLGLSLAFGLLAGGGIGLGYAAATPAAVKWFPPEKKGLITGIVVSGFGLAPVYISPLTKHLLGTYGTSSTFLYLGIGFLVVSILCATLMQTPAVVSAPASKGATNTAASTKKEFEFSEMLKTSQFYLLWLMFALGAFAGLMVIGNLATFASPAIGAFLVALLAVFNAGGRLIAGIVSDKIGRTKTMLLVFASQALFMALFPNFIASKNDYLLMLGSAAAGFNYGALLSLFPSTTGDYFGTKNLGVNYGLVFTAWGVGGVFGPLVAGYIKDTTGDYNMAFYSAAVLCVIAGAATFLTKAPSTQKASDGFSIPAMASALMDDEKKTENK